MGRCASRAVITVGLLTIVGLLWSGHAADAAPIQFGDNFYEYIPDEAVSWAEASTAASADIFNGMQGHLATITTAAENSFLQGLNAPLPGFQGAWLGGAVNGSNQASWAVGPEAGQLISFNNFGGVEPNDGPGNIYMNIGLLFAGIANGQWADAANGLNSSGNPIAGYFVEYESVVTTPLPAALPLLLTGLGGIGFLGWRRKQQAATVSAR
jgi:hypothetical protein